MRGPHTFYPQRVVSTILSNNKMSALVDGGDAAEPIQVLFALHDQMNLLDFAGPLEVLNHALHNVSDPGLLLVSF